MSDENNSKALKEKLDELQELFDNKFIENYYINLKELTNYFKYIMTINFAIIPITIAGLSFLIDNIDVLLVTYILIGIGLLFSVLSILFCFVASIPYPKLLIPNLAVMKDRLSKQIKFLAAFGFGTIITIALITIGFIITIIN